MSIREKVGQALVSLLPTAPILVPLAGHFLLVNLAMLATMLPLYDTETDDINGIWLPLTYIFYNIVFFHVGVWSVQEKDKIFPVAVFIFVVVVSAISDIIILGTTYTNGSEYVDDFDNAFETMWRFSSGMMVINLIGKPFTIALCCVSIYFRTGASVPGFSTGRAPQGDPAGPGSRGDPAGPGSRGGTYQAAGDSRGAYQPLLGNTAD